MPCSSRPNLAATLLRFVLYRGWVFGEPREAHAVRDQPAATRRRAAPRAAARLRPPLSMCRSATLGPRDERHHHPRSRRGAARRRAAAPPVWRGPARDPQWARPALFGLLAVTALLYLWDLSRNGYANDFYAAAVQAGTRSWKAFFFGSFDSSNFITVDKTPASLWVDELSARIFGFGSWSLLAPQAVEGVRPCCCCTPRCAAGSGRRPA